MRPVSSILFLLTALIHAALAGGTPYSRYGLGDLIYFGSNRSDAMGGVSLGLRDDGFINRLNPAGLSRISLTRFSGSFEYSRINSTDGLTSGKFARGDFKGLAFAIPISTPHGIVLEGDITPFSVIRYATILNDNTSPYPSTQTFHGSGGINTFNVALSYQPTTWLSVGAKLNYYTGTTRQRTVVDFADASFTDSDIHTTRYLSGFGGTFGIQYSGFAEHLGIPALAPLTLGAVVIPPVRLRGTQERVVYYSPFDFDTTNTQKTSVNIPSGAGLGLSYLFRERYILAADIFMQQWQGVNFFGTIPVEIKDRTRLGIGFEVLPPKELTGYWSRVHFRAGIYYHSTYVKLQGQSINEMGATVGGSFPIGPDARVNLGLQYGVRGTTANNLQKDNVIRFNVSFSASEMWFVRIEED